MDEEKKQEMTKRTLLSNRMKEKYPEMNVDDEEIMYGQIMDDYDNLENENKGYRDREKTIVDMYTADPKSAYFMEEWRKGGDPAIELIRTFGDELREALDDPEKQDALAEAHKEYVERVAENKKMEEEFEKNMNSTLDYLKQLADEGAMSDEQIDDAMEKLFTIVHDGIVGKFAPETIKMIAKGIAHDSDVEEASHVGEVRGRNAKIDEKLRKNNKGDGISALNGKNGEAPSEPRRHISIFDRAAEAM